MVGSVKEASVDFGFDVRDYGAAIAGDPKIVLLRIKRRALFYLKIPVPQHTTKGQLWRLTRQNTPFSIWKRGIGWKI
jgi:hypothetical protein